MFALTGASGWLGLNAIEAFIETNPSSSLRLFTSNGRDILGRKTFPLSDISNFSDYSGLFHTAFSKRAALNKMSVDEYAQVNRSISSTVVSAIQRCQNDLPIVITSSGVARPTNHIGSINDDPYAFLKREEETLLSRLSTNRMIVIFRLFGAIGPHLKLSDHYALSSFISQSNSTGLIKLEASSPVYRGYLFLPSFCQLVWNLLKNPLPSGCYIFDACSSVISIKDLAYMIAYQMGSSVVTNTQFSCRDLNYYCGDVQPYLQLLKDRGIVEPSIHDQLDLTIKRAY